MKTEIEILRDTINEMAETLRRERTEMTLIFSDVIPTPERGYTAEPYMMASDARRICQELKNLRKLRDINNSLQAPVNRRKLLLACIEPSGAQKRAERTRRRQEQGFRMNIETHRTPQPSKRAEIRALIAANRTDYDERIAPKKRERQERYLRTKRERERE